MDNVESRMKYENQPPPKGRLILGGIIFISGFFSPALIPWVLTWDISNFWKTTISGGLAFGIPELFMIMAAAILGKSGFSYLKKKLLAILQKHGPPDEVNPARHKIGLVMFIIPLLAGFLLPYLWNHLPFVQYNLLWFVISGDVLLLCSLFVLGGDFWDKLRGLFFRSAKIQYKPKHQQ